MKRTLAMALVAVGVVVIAHTIFGRPLGRMLFERAVASNIARGTVAELPDVLHVVLCGSGSPLADPERAGPCTAVIAGKRLFIVDIGSGAARNLGPMNLNIGVVDGLFLTHFHSDHIDGLGELMTLRWATGNRKEPLPVYGPTGVEQVVGGFDAAYALDKSYRVAHHGETVVPPAGHGAIAHAFDASAPAVVLDEGGLKVTAFPVDHRPIVPAVGYRFDYRGRSVVISGDTAPDERIAVAAKGADLLVHEALSADMLKIMQRQLAAVGRKNAAKVMDDIQNYHTTPVEAAEIASKSGVRTLVLTHIVPPLPSRLLERFFLGDATQEFRGDIVVGRDGMLFSLPVGSDAIDRRALN